MNKKLVSLIREEFFKLLESKTGWGRNEIKTIFDQAINNALMRLMDEE